MEKPPILQGANEQTTIWMQSQRDADFRWHVGQLKKMGKETLVNGLHIDHWILAEQWKAMKEEVSSGLHL